MAGLSRRTVLISAGAGAGALALAGGGYWVGQQFFSGVVPAPLVTGAPGTEPAVLRSSAGKLSVNLVAEHTHSTVGGRSAHVMTYNGTTPGPTLIAQPGDTITVNFTNKLGEPTNLHTHGLHVSPAGNSDNVFIEVQSGETVQYQYELGTDHPTGVYWYHPHHHGMAADQVFGGLYGALIVSESSPIPATAERVLVVSDITLDAAGSVASVSEMDKMMGREGATILLNGQISPKYTSSPGATERWRIVNACTSRYLNLSVPGGSALILGMDSGQFAPPSPMTNITLAPGNRADLMVTVGSAPATLAYTTVVHRDMKGMGGTTTTYTDYPLATFNPVGTAAAAATGAIARIPGPNLRNVTVSAKRSFKLAMPAGMGGMGGLNGQFTINGKAFDMNTVNTTVSLGTVEEWTIMNTTTMDHPFHLHVWPMQVLTSGTTSFDGVHYRDVVNVPANSQAVVRVHFDKFAGQAVYHCHILDHEDFGMMGIIEAK
jgi:FtsP/CotA-like multicopper oxidase with cupredoxin domain